MSATTKPRRGERSAVLLRNSDQILAGATLALAENPAASMQEIAEHSGVVRATLYRHFSSREDLLREIHRSATESAETALEAAEPERGPALEALRRQIEALLEVADRYRIVTEHHLAFAELGDEVDQVPASLVELIERGQEEGEVRTDLPARWLAGLLPTLCGAALSSLADGTIEPDGAADVVAKTLLESVEPR